MSETVELTGTVEKVIFRSQESGFTVCSLKVNSKTSVTVTGHLPNLHQGEQATMRGEWGFHQKFGRQFVAKE